MNHPKTSNLGSRSAIAIGVGATFGAALFLLCGTLWAQLIQPKAIITFEAPVEVPGSAPQVLPAGTYTFTVMDSKVNRNIVQISNKDETQILTTILAVPISREHESDKSVLLFEERAAGEPQALRAWFYPHYKQGQEFVYSKSRAAELSKSSNSPVPYSESNVNDASAAGSADSSPILRMTPAGESGKSQK